MLLGAAVVGYPLYQVQQRLETLQSKLHGVGEVAVRAKAGAVASKESGLRLDHELEKADAERQTLESQLQDATSRIEQLRDDLETAKESGQERQVRLASVQSKVDGVKQTAEQAEAQAAGVDKKVATLKDEVDEGSTKRDGLRAELQSSNADLDQLRTQLEASRSRLTKMRAHLNNLEGVLEGSKETAKQVKAAAAALKNQTTTLKSQLEAGKAERNALRDKLDQAHSQIEKLKDASLKIPPLTPQADETALGAACKARDYLARTIAFEGAGETEVGKVAIAYVVLNRERSGRWGDSVKDVVTSPWQFEPWMTRRKAIKNLSRTDPLYKDSARVADTVLMGEVPDPTDGATHFLNPVVVRHRRGGTLPLWARGKGQPIGRHVFYSPGTDRTLAQQSDDGRLEPTALYDPASASPGSG